ncbi:MAG: TatD family hydrolase [Chloroflexota bacterium]|nr:TatD family hydrolase [Chloroflexota bacterium]
MFDSHAHLADPGFAGDLDGVRQRAAANGVDEALVVATDLPTSARAIAMSQDFPGWYATVGVHPHDCGGFDTTTVDALRKLAGNRGVRAIGESGLDFYRDHQPRELQELAFRAHCRLAADLDLPIVIHQRDSLDAVEGVLREELGAAGGVMHSFTGPPASVPRFVDLGLHISISGIVTFKRADEVRETAAAIPGDRLLIETDAPYLAPTPMRGRRNEPAYLTHTAAVVASVRNVSVSSLRATTTRNARELFRCAPTP